MTPTDVLVTPALEGMWRTVERVASTSLPVLILGESGTGKEVVARAVHATSPRAQQPFVTVDCSAIPPSLMESELFGHERGSFTGASSTRMGLVSEADHGTLFLDEIGELPLGLQPKLLRLLQHGEVRRIGANRTRHVDLRIIAATHRDPDTMVATGTFRADLLHRIDGLRLTIPPLRDRPHDALLLMHHILERTSKELGKPTLALSPELEATFARYAWPGNVREVLHVARTLASLALGPVATENDLPPSLRQRLTSQDEPAVVPGIDLSVPYKTAKHQAERAFEAAYLAAILQDTGGNMSEAARRMGLDRRSVQRLARRLRT